MKPPCKFGYPYYTRLCSFWGDKMYMTLYCTFLAKTVIIMRASGVGRSGMKLDQRFAAKKNRRVLLCGYYL